MNWNRITDAERKAIATVRGSSMLKTIIAEEFKAHCADRAQRIASSEQRRKDLLAQDLVAQADFREADRKLKLAEEELRKVREAHSVAWSRINGTNAVCDREIYVLRKTLGESAHPDIGTLFMYADKVLDVLPGALNIGISTVLDEKRGSFPEYYSNEKHLRGAAEQLRQIQRALSSLMESAYDESLFRELRRYYDEVRAIVKAFDLKLAERDLPELSFLEPETERTAAAA